MELYVLQLVMEQLQTKNGLLMHLKHNAQIFVTL